MLRITRFISKKRIADLVQLPNVLKIEIHRAINHLKNPNIAKVDIFLVIHSEDCKAVFSPNFDTGYQKSLLLRMEKYGQKHNINDMLVSAQKARQMGFLTESMCTDVKIQNKYLRLIKTYSQSFFDIWNYEKPSFEV